MQFHGLCLVACITKRVRLEINFLHTIPGYCYLTRLTDYKFIHYPRYGSHTVFWMLFLNCVTFRNIPVMPWNHSYVSICQAIIFINTLSSVTCIHLSTSHLITTRHHCNAIMHPLNLQIKQCGLFTVTILEQSEQPAPT